MYDLEPEQQYSFKRSRELSEVLNTGEVPQVVVTAYRDSRLPGKYALETAEAPTGEAETEKDREAVLKNAVARMSSTAVEDWGNVRIQRVVLFLATIRRYTSDEVFTHGDGEAGIPFVLKGSVPKSDLPDVDASPRPSWKTHTGHFQAQTLRGCRNRTSLCGGGLLIGG